MKNDLSEYMESYIGHLKAVEMWLHSAHQVAKGAGFASDHKNLYGEMYIKLGDNFDALVEKSIGLSGSEIFACPARISIAASHVLNNHYETPVEKSAVAIVKGAINCITNLISSLTSLYEKFQSEGFLTLGLDDLLSSMANEYENYLYLLGQRYKD